MSFTSFLFGNVDKEGKLSDSELNDELRDTLGGEDAGDYLSGVLGSALFNDSSSGSDQQKKRKRGSEEHDSDDDNYEYDGAKTEGTETPVNASSAIRPAKDAIDFSDFNELADDAAVPVKWNQPEEELASTSSFKYSSSIVRAQVDDDYDSDEDDKQKGGVSGLFTASAEPGEPVLAVMAADEAGMPSVDNHDLPMDSDEESLEDLFDSTAKPSVSTDKHAAVNYGDELVGLGPASTDPKAQVEDKATKLLESAVDHRRPVVPRAAKKIPPGIIKFTDFFGCQIVRQARKPRRNRPPENEDDDEYQQQQQQQQQHDFHSSQQRLSLAQPALDTRKLLSGTQQIPKHERYLKEFLSLSMAADSKSDLYITIDANTGAATSQTTGPKKHMAPSSELFQRMPYPLDIEDWEGQVVWEDSDVQTQGGAPKPSDFDKEQMEDDAKPDALNILARSKNGLLEDFESHIIWDPDTPFQPCTQLQINMNDTHMLFEDANSIKESHAREAERQRLLEGVDRFNLSNDHFYEALQEGKVHRVRQTFGQLIIAHSLPSLRLQPPYFKMRNTRSELRSLHRPFLQAPLDTAIKFSRVRTAKKRKQKHSMENPWASKDITLKDSADCVLIEYAEEYPPVMSNVGMGSVFVNYYRKRNIQDLAFPKVDLGELFILDVADISPFLNFGNIEPGQVVPALYNNMFRAPLFQQKVKKTDYLVVKHVSKGESKWYVRGFKYQYIVGQTYPLQEVPAPHSRKVTTTIKHRLQVAAYRLMNRNQYHLLQMGKLTRLFPEYSELQIRQRLKEFCEYQRKGLGAGYWRPKHNMPIPDEENLRKMLTPEMLCLFESMRVCQQQLHDAGKLGDEGEDDGDDAGDSKLSIEELLATWNLTRNFLNATQGKAMLKLYGEGDPTGIGEGFSFVRVSMKDIFLRAGESVEEKLAEIEARPKSAHRYNVAEQQQIYKDEISCIWNKQFRSLTLVEPPRKHVSEARSDENIIVPEINDMFGDSATGQGVAAIEPTHMVPGSAMDVSNKMVRGSQPTQKQTMTTVHANFIQPNKKGLIIRRAVKSPYTGELMWRTEVVKDLAVIQAYLRQRRIIENLAHSRDSQYEDEDDDEEALFASSEPKIDFVGETQAQLARLKRARDRRNVETQVDEKSHMTTFSLPQPNKPKKDTIRRCGNCGKLGHMKTNKKCPRYFEFNPV
ncbi:hypothetical protein EV178_001677 [Coemansia sp. RSA 1646]|nr:hypothetical protein EV178_001677 [Coemansia sp. RSA 1646]KAJ1773401.1 hypothetical protein LPJ74_000654 [Coemansia sp. RSA 1843]